MNAISIAALLCVASFLAPLTLCSASTDAPPASAAPLGAYDTNTVLGWVTAKNNGTPISGAVVMLKTQGSGGEDNLTYTNGSGYYEINAADGTYTGFAAFTGYNFSMAIMELEGGVTKVQNFSLAPAGVTDVLVVGYLTDLSTSLPIPSTQVVCYVGGSQGPPSYAVFCVTNATGYYSFAMPPGNGQVDTFSAVPGYYKNYTNYAGSSGQTVWANLSLMPLPPYMATIKGYVNETGTGNPADYARIDSSNDDGSFSNHTHANSSGYYEMQVLPGEIGVQASSASHSQSYEKITAAANETYWLNFTLAPRIEPSILKGRIVDGSTGAGIPFAYVSIDDGKEYKKYWSVDAGGNFEFSVASGKMNAYAQAEGYFRQMALLTILANATVWQNFTLAKAPEDSCTLTGYVLDATNGNPVPDASVDVSLGSKWDNRTKTDSSGFYAMQVLPGTLEMRVYSDKSYHYESYEVAAIENATVWQNVSLYPVLTDNATLMGYVNDSVSGSPIPYASVEASGYPFFTNRTEANGTGFYMMNIVPAPQMLRYRSWGYDKNDQNVSLPPQGALWLNITLDPDQTPPGFTAFKWNRQYSVSKNMPLSVGGSVTEENLDAIKVYLMKERSPGQFATNYTVYEIYSSRPQDGFIKERPLELIPGGGPGEYNFSWETNTSVESGGIFGNATASEYTQNLMYVSQMDRQAVFCYYLGAGFPSPAMALAFYDAGGAIESLILNPGRYNESMAYPADDPGATVAPVVYTRLVNNSNGYFMWPDYMGPGTFTLLSDTTYTPSPHLLSGNYGVVCQAQDWGWASANRYLPITIDNDPPAADAGADIYAMQHAAASLNGSASQDNFGIVNYTWSYIEGGATKEAYGADPAVSFAGIGNYTVTLEVFDAAGYSATAQTVAHVSDGEAPAADAGPDQTVEIHSSVTFNGTASQDNVLLVNYTWSFTDGQPFTLYGPNPQHTFDSIGNYTVTLLVADAAGLNSTGSMTVNVGDFTPPSAAAGANQTVEYGTTLIFNATGSTDNGWIANYTWSVSGASAAVGYGIVFKHNFTALGKSNVTLTVTDEAGNSASAAVAITVRDTTSPTADAGEGFSVGIGKEARFNASGSTDNVGIANYTWNFTEGAAVKLYGKTPSHAFSSLGSYNVTLTVKDTSGNTAKGFVVVAVVDDIAPTADAGADITVEAGAAVAFDGSNSTDNIGVANYTWSFADITPQALFGAAPSYTFKSAGNYTVTLAVRDAANNTANDTVVVHVTPRKAPSADNPDSGAIPLYVYIIVIAVVVAAVAAAAYIVAKGRKGPKGPMAPPKESETDGGEGGESEAEEEDAAEEEPPKAEKPKDSPKAGPAAAAAAAAPAAAAQKPAEGKSATPAQCPTCAEKLKPGMAECPSCGESL